MIILTVTVLGAMFRERHPLLQQFCHLANTVKCSRHGHTATTSIFQILLKDMSGLLQLTLALILALVHRLDVRAAVREAIKVGFADVARHRLAFVDGEIVIGHVIRGVRGLASLFGESADRSLVVLGEHGLAKVADTFGLLFLGQARRAGIVQLVEHRLEIGSVHDCVIQSTGVGKQEVEWKR